MDQRSWWARLGWITGVLAAILLPGRGIADGIKPLPPDGTLYGMKLSDWATAWFQWEFSIPWTVNPVTETDLTGKGAAIGQRTPVWFIPPFEPGFSGTRTITIPEGQAILVNAAQSSARQQPGAASDAALLHVLDETVAGEINQITQLEVNLDGVPVPNLEAYRVRTPVFSVLAPPGYTDWMGIDVSKDARLAVAVEGYFVMFPPLPAGMHVLTQKRAGGNAGDSVYTFNLRVLKPNEPLP